MPKSSGRRRAFLIVMDITLIALALVAIYIIDAAFFPLKVKINPKNGGTVSVRISKENDEWTMRSWTTAILKAEESDGYVFTGWSGASTSAVTPLTIALDGKTVLTANFERFEPRSVQIGNRRWMAENLNVIPAKSWCYDDNDESRCIAGKSYCYDNDENNCRKYGRLYDYEAAMVACPAPWRLPTKDDWNSLIRVGGYKTGEKLKSKTGWDDWKCGEVSRSGHTEKTDCTPGSVYSGNGTDEFGFSALPGGSRYDDVGKSGIWWADARNYEPEWYYLIYYTYELMNTYCRAGFCGGDGSIRCVQDIPGVSEKVVGSDGPPPPIIRSWEYGATTVTFYADGMVRVSGNGKMEDCIPEWEEYSRFASQRYCKSPWRDYQVTGLIIEEGVTHIGSRAFDGCYIMSSVTIPNSVASIGHRAFGYCTSLRSIIIRNPNPPRIATMFGNASDVFEKNYENIMEKACLYVPANSIGAYRAADGWKEFGCIKELAETPEGK